MKKVTDRISFDVIVPAIFALILLAYPFELVRVRFNLFAQDMKPVEVWKGEWEESSLGYPYAGCSSVSRIGNAMFIVLADLTDHVDPHVIQLQSLVDIHEDLNQGGRVFDTPFYDYDGRARKYLVWRIDTPGKVSLVATSPAEVCMTTTPDGAIYARTGIAVQSGEGGHERLSDAVFRSDDRGNTWSYHSADWGGPSIGVVWGVDVVFSDSTNVWAYHNEFDSSGPAMSHSMDQGRTWRVVEEINAAEAAVLKQIAPEANLAFFNREMLRTLFVNEDKSVDLWVSGENYEKNNRIPHGLVTQRISLRETTNGWAVSTQHHYPGVYVKFIEKDEKGVLRGIVSMGSDQWIGTFNPISDRWEKTADLPTLFWKPMSSYLRVNKAHFTEKVWVIQLEDTHRVSRWIFPWSDAEISSKYRWLYSTDQGASWTKLNIGSSLIGFDRDLGRLYVVENWPDKMLGFLPLVPVDEANGNLPDLSKSM